MSAIYGAIDLKGNILSEDLQTRFNKGYDKCRIDRYGHILDSNVSMSCGIQYFYPRAELEKLPIHEINGDVFITADCVLDNRKKLLDELSLDETMPDGDIIFEAYKKWGDDCARHLEGLFAFVVYDRKRNEVIAAVDQFCQRCLFYHVRDGVFYFSTLFFPLLEGSGLKFEENERWLVDTVSLRSPALFLEPKETAVKDVYKIVCGTQIKISVDDNNKLALKEERYFDPNKEIPTDWSITIEQSESMVKETMFNIVSDIIHDQKDVAAQLSSGLDSSTVACTAATILKKRGGNDKIYSYTSIPLKEAGLKPTRLETFDETEKVKIICEEYPNIEPSFVESKETDYMPNADYFVDLWELPCKSQQNAVWIDDIARLASARGSRILLCGSTGNCTVSAGRFEDVFFYYISKLKIIKAFHTLDAIKKLDFSRKRYIRYTISEIKKHFKLVLDKTAVDFYEDNLTDKSIGEKYYFAERYRQLCLDFFPVKTMKGMRKEMYMPNSCAQIGEVDTKTSLKYGILSRDPMRTVPFMQLCFKLPIYCYAQGDYDRRLVRAGMKGIVPDEIRNEIINRGRQSGDNVFRIKRSWPKVKEQWKKVMYEDEVARYFDREKFTEFIKKTVDNIDEANKTDVMFLSNLYSFGLFLKRIREFM